MNFGRPNEKKYNVFCTHGNLRKPSQTMRKPMETLRKPSGIPWVGDKGLLAWLVQLDLLGL